MSPTTTPSPSPTSTTKTTTTTDHRHSPSHVIDLCGGRCVLRVDDRRAVIDILNPPPPSRVDRNDDGDGGGNGDAITVSDERDRCGGLGGVERDCECDGGWTVLSSAVLNGGLVSGVARSRGLHVLNAKVPADYDGVDPDPESLLLRIAADEGLLKCSSPGEKQHDDPSSPSKTTESDVFVIGLLTAASMRTLRTASRSAGGVSVDVVVTAGLSNARAVGADADCFLFGDEGHADVDDETNAAETDGPSSRSGSSTVVPPGTINTVVVTDARLTPSALVEAYAIAVEAKCAVCSELGVPCAKSGVTPAQGTGTDSAVLVARSSITRTTSGEGRRCKCCSVGREVSYAGKHCLFAELVGQAVREATRESILTNIRHVHGHRRTALLEYSILNRIRSISRAIRCTGRPCVPPRPGTPVPWPSASALVVGSTVILSLALVPVIFGLDLILPRPARLLLAAIAWDRYLGEPPLVVHPVILVGKLISSMLRRLPPYALSYDRPVLGFITGAAMCLTVLATSVGAAWVVLSTTGVISDCCVSSESAAGNAIGTALCDLPTFAVETIILKSTFSPHLLFAVALRMAHLLERGMIDDARTQLSWLCSRDPSNLTSEELAGATLESLSENLSDGFVAPLLWYFLGAAAAAASRGCSSPSADIIATLSALAYRTINTLDSRVGYRDRGFEYLGKFSARLDDVVNWIPARLTALCLAASASISVRSRSVSGRRAMEVARRDSQMCDSPNAGWPMGAMAGALGVTLEKRGHYRLNGVGRQPGPVDVRTGERVARLAGRMAVMAAVAAVVVVSWSTCPSRRRPHSSTTSTAAGLAMGAICTDE